MMLLIYFTWSNLTAVTHRSRIKQLKTSKREHIGEIVVCTEISLCYRKINSYKTTTTEIQTIFLASEKYICFNCVDQDYCST